MPIVGRLTGQRPLRAVLATATLAVLCAAAPAAAKPFAPDSWVNAPLADGAPLDPHSSMMVNELVKEVDRRGAAVNHSCWSTPVWTVKRRQRKVRVGTAGDHPALDEQFARVPLPGRANAACGNDAQLTVWQPSTDTLWGFFGFHRGGAGNPVATFGGRIRGVSQSPGYFTDDPGPRFGATATSIPLLAGLERVRE